MPIFSGTQLWCKTRPLSIYLVSLPLKSQYLNLIWQQVTTLIKKHCMNNRSLPTNEKTMRKQTKLNRQNHWVTPEVNIHLAI